MTVLRSREILPTKTTPNTPTPTPNRKRRRSSIEEMEPSTPAQKQEPFSSTSLTPHTPSSPSTNPDPLSNPTSVSAGLGSDSVSVSGVTRRRSLRLVSRVEPEERAAPNLMEGGRRRRKGGSRENGGVSTAEKEEARRSANGEETMDGEASFRPMGKKSSVIQKLKMDSSADQVTGAEEESLRDSQGKRKLEIDIDFPASESREDEDEGALNLRSRKRVAKRRIGRVVAEREEDVQDKEEMRKKELVKEDCVELDSEVELETESFSVQEAEASRRRKGKEKMDCANGQGIDTEIPEESAFSYRNLIDPVEAAIAFQNLVDTIESQKKSLTRTGKGKEKLVEDDSLPGSNDESESELGLESEIAESVDIMLKSAVNLNSEHNVALDEGWVGQPSSSSIARKGLGMERFREIANDYVKTKVAKKKGEKKPGKKVETRRAAEVGPKQDVEDWPGPFRTAMKIIRDRAKKFVPVEDSSLGKSKPRQVIWAPKKRQDQDRVKPLAPSLLELSVMGLAKNADAIASLELVPDALRHRLCSVLCASRTMSTRFFKLLLHGSPTEIRVRDCSWLTEEQFTNSLQGLDLNNLNVLQLDLCGRCLPDYVVLATLAQSSNNMPALTTLSLTGACRLSDVGLEALISSAPALRSINLSQCSFLTSSSINSLANSFGSSLRELYLDDCQSIDTMFTLPALKRLEQLEVLSLAGNEKVCDDFITHFIRDRGNNMKQLVLAGCINLTDSSLKVVAETCSQLSKIDLMNLCKLTDSTLGYLANGCQTIQILKLCRNQFSDEGVAAFLESSGEHLQELWLNNVKKVGYNTALSLARCSSRLHTLDLSWCRSLTDEALGLIVDNCLSLRLLKLFGCTQITNVFLDGHSNPDVKIVGLPMSNVLKDKMVPDPVGELHYFSLPPST